MAVRTQRHRLNGMRKKQYAAVRDVALGVTALEDELLYQNALQVMQTGYQTTRFEALWGLAHELDAFKAINVDLANAVTRRLAGNIKSAVTKWREGDTHAGIPHEKHRRQPSVIPIPKKYINTNKGAITIPGKDWRTAKDRQVPIPANIPEGDWGKITAAKIVPKANGAWYELHVTIDDGAEPPEPKTVEEASRIVTVDPGIDNLMTCTAFDLTLGEEDVLDVMIFDGRELKSRNQWFNKQVKSMSLYIDGLEEAQPHRYLRRVNRTYDRLRVMYEDRDSMFDWVARTYAADFVRWCLLHRVEFVAFSWNDGFKQDLHMGRKANQAFSCLPLARLRDFVRDACLKVGIGFDTFEESYTSKASALAEDYMPAYGELSVEERKQIRFSGRRTHRGLYVVTLDGVRYELNADVNANINQLEKCKPGSRRALMGRLGRAGLVAAVSRPKRERLLNEGRATTTCRKNAVRRAENGYGNVTTVRSDNPKKKSLLQARP